MRPTVMTVTATDPDHLTTTFAFSIAGGVDAAKFTINPTTGALSFVTAPDFEVPTDTGANSIYDVNVRVSDGLLATTQAIAVTVTNVAGVTLNGTAGADTVTGTSEADTLSGLGGNDILTGLGGNDIVNGGDGNDTFVASVGDGNNSYNGGAGTDTYDLSATTADATVNLALRHGVEPRYRHRHTHAEHDRERDRRRRQRHPRRQRAEQRSDR